MADIDDLASSLAASFAVTETDGHTTNRNHPSYRSQQYKNKGERTSAAGQNNRRLKLLEEQKKRREALLEIKRKGKFQDGDEEEGEERQEEEVRKEKVAAESDEKILEELEENMDINEIARKPQRRRHDQYWNTFKNTLMFSEWMVEVPSDLSEEWLVVPVPMGKRSLVVASHNKTCAFSKGGMHLNTFESQLPNGSRSRRQDSKYLLFDSRYAGDTMLDCIFSPHLFTYFALDMLMWQDYDVRDCDTEFRMWWLHSKLSELSGHSQSNINVIRIPCYPCTREGVRQCFSWQPYPNDTIELDGLLFYHKKTAYTPGETPLVSWLKPFMVPEVLGFDVPTSVQNQTPEGYSDFRSHINEFNEGEALKKAKHLERVEKRKQKQEDHVAMEMAKTIEPKRAGSKKSFDSQEEIANQLGQSKSKEDKGGWLSETLEESLAKTKNKNSEDGPGAGILDELNLDETGSFSKMEELLERKMAMDAQEVECEIEEIKRMEMKPGTLPLEALSFDITQANVDDNQTIPLIQPAGAESQSPADNPVFTAAFAS